MNMEPDQSESILPINNLIYDPGDADQKALARELVIYANNIESLEFHHDDRLINALYDNGIPFPQVNINSIQWLCSFHLSEDGENSCSTTHI